MKRLVIELENCYGIKTLSHQFDFTDKRAYAIYAQNGAMKSSLARTFQDIVDGKPSSDRVFTARQSRRNINDENGTELQKENILVVQPYNEQLEPSEKTATLLVDQKLRIEYEQLYNGVKKAKEALLDALKKQSHSKKDLEKEISSAFTNSEDDFYLAMVRIKSELQEQKDTPFADVTYDVIFDDKVLAFLETKDAKATIREYFQRYNELLDASTYFKKGTFDYYNAGQIAKTLADNGFFEAKHSVNLNATEKKEIRTQKELEELIAKEKELIIKDAQLMKNFNAVQKQLEKNATLREFQNYILKNEPLLSQLVNVRKFKEDVWKSYLKSRFDLYSDLMSKYEGANIRKKEIERTAAGQRTQWEEVIKIFNERFFVPFELSAINRTAVMLGEANAIILGFTYRDGADNVSINRPDLLKVLSTGEKRALYILNIIFEIEIRTKTNQETLIIVDDIADSFDYQNKYAIIQYLKDINQNPLFKQIIMTHNFDFFRTINSRFVPYAQCLMSSKSHTGITLEKATGIKNIFVNDWKQHFFDDNKKKIASIPFIRNLVEFTKGESDPTFLKLTSLLHWKSDSAGITISDLDDVYRQTIQANGTSANGSQSVTDLIQNEAQSCTTAGAAINLENKIVLAIAIRIGAERFMVNKINDTAFVNAITSNQTDRLLTKFKQLFPSNTQALDTLGRVTLMTPENIHLNSFMYEPIIDMSDENLRRLYRDVLALK